MAKRRRRRRKNYVNRNNRSQRVNKRHQIRKRLLESDRFERNFHYDRKKRKRIRRTDRRIQASNNENRRKFREAVRKLRTWRDVHDGIYEERRFRQSYMFDTAAFYDERLREKECKRRKETRTALFAHKRIGKGIRGPIDRIYKDTSKVRC